MADERLYEDLTEQFEGDPEYEFFRALDEVVDQICIAMEREGVSRSELAGRLGVSRQYVTNFLNDPGNPTLQSLVRVANALDMVVQVEVVPRRVAMSGSSPWSTTSHVDAADWRTEGSGHVRVQGGAMADDIGIAA